MTDIAKKNYIEAHPTRQGRATLANRPGPLRWT